MSKYLTLIILFFTAAGQVFAQTDQPAEKSKRPDIPGTFVVELGLNRALDGPQLFSLGLWGSRTVNVLYQYDIRILKSRFSFVPGIGLGLERFKFKNGGILGYDEDDSLKILGPATAGFPGLKKSQLITNFVDVPLELRYSSKPEDPARSFKASVGARVGYMYDSFVKLKYKEDGQIRKLKDKRDFDFNRVRYGVFGKIGLGNFSLVGYYNLNTLFKEGEGLVEDDFVNDFQTFTVGISLSSF
jgi:hypothetical protein